MLITFLDLSFLTWSTNHKDLLFVFRHQKAYSQHWRSYMFQKGHIFLLPCLYHRLVDFNCQMILWNLLLIVLKDPVRTMQNFVFFDNKKSVNRKPFLVRTILFFKYQNFLRCVKTSKMPLRKFLRPTIFLSGDKIFCSFTAILRRVILFREHDLTFFVTWKLSRTSGANKVTETKNW